MGYLSAVHIAALRQNVSCLKYLLECAGAKWNVPDNNGCTPLMIAAWCDSKTTLLHTLLDHAQDIQPADFEAKGIPPMTSSCGGEEPRSCMICQPGRSANYSEYTLLCAGNGPFNSYIWAHRKGHYSVCVALFKKWQETLCQSASKEAHATIGQKLRDRLNAEAKACGGVDSGEGEVSCDRNCGLWFPKGDSIYPP